jgi:protein-disulfide isomerase
MEDLRTAPVPAVHADDHVRGPDTAPVVIVYADFTCPRCALAHRRLQGVAMRRVFRHFALRSKHPRAVALARAAEAAGRQGAFWEMHDSLFADQGRLDDPHLWERVRALGLDLDRFERDRRDPSVAEHVAQDVRAALRAGVTITPTLVAAGALHPGAPDDALLERLARARD